jgi:hypothetical protein
MDDDAAKVVRPLNTCRPAEDQAIDETERDRVDTQAKRKDGQYTEREPRRSPESS